ncbi:MAG: ABC transporter ATP-binding protein [Chloroflexi bacterium]|nr:ABC transporter ATP-binding protein [Chloroflexota bacterium]
MNDAAAISVKGLRKAYGANEAVRGIDLEVRTGEVFALLGPNGAGKTTTVEILEGFRERDAGDVRVLGYDPAHHDRAFRERVGIVLQSTSLSQYLTVEETIEQYRGYYARPRPLGEILDVVGLGEQRDVRTNRLSGGQQRRLDVAVGLAGDPELLFLDEPTTGFDPAARRNAWELITNLKALGKTVLLTTHYMDEAEHLADRVAIVVQGQIVAQGAPRELAKGEQAAVIRFALPQGARALPGELAAARSANGLVEIETEEATRLLHQLTSWALEHEAELEGLTVSRASLEETYLRLTREAERQAAETPPAPAGSRRRRGRRR